MNFWQLLVNWAIPQLVGTKKAKTVLPIVNGVVSVTNQNNIVTINKIIEAVNSDSSIAIAAAVAEDFGLTSTSTTQSTN